MVWYGLGDRLWDMFSIRKSARHVHALSSGGEGVIGRCVGSMHSWSVVVRRNDVTYRNVLSSIRRYLMP